MDSEKEENEMKKMISIVLCLAAILCVLPMAASATGCTHATDCSAQPICTECLMPSGSHSYTVPATCTAPAKCACGAEDPSGATAPHSYGSDGKCVSCSTPATSFNVSVSTTKFTYNGASQKPAVTVTTGNTVLSSSCYEVAYTGDTKNAGTYTITVTGKNGLDINYSTDITIAPAALTVGPNNITINQNAGTPVASLYFSGLVAGETVSVTPAPVFKFYATSGDQSLLNDPVNFLGKYTITWENMDACGINISSGNGNYTITKVKNGTLNVIPTKANFTIAGVKLYGTVDGYAVNLHKVSGSNLEKILDNPEKDGTIQLTFDPVSWLGYLNTIRVPTELVEAIAEAANDAKSDVKALELTLPNGRTIKFDAEALDDIAGKAEGKFVAVIMVKSTDVKTSEAEPLTSAQKKDLGERPAYVFAIASGKEVLADIDGKLVMQIPYVLRYKETAEGMEVFSIDEDGKREAVETSYDEEDKKVVWNTDSLGMYVIEAEK